MTTPRWLRLLHWLLYLPTVPLVVWAGHQAFPDNAAARVLAELLLAMTAWLIIDLAIYVWRRQRRERNRHG